jgi:hypothetical protein
MAATYDTATALGKARLFAADTNVLEAIFDDDEWQVFLDAEGQSPLLAAALGLETMAADAAKVAIITKNDVVSTDPSKIAQQLSDRAAALRSRAAAGSGSTAVMVNDAIFIPSRTADGTSNAETTALAGGNQEPW